MISRFYNDWQIQSQSTIYNEIELFRLLAKLLSTHLPTVFSDETHGNVAQVEFTSTYIAGLKPTCEISDLLILVYSNRKKEIRASFLQAKRRSRFYPGPRPHFSFTGDLHQYDLLANRPLVKGVNAFNPNPRILADAILPSIGSYGIFYKTRSFQHVEFYYASAINIVPRSAAMRKTPMYIPVSGNDHYFTDGHYHELVSCSRMDKFAHNLIAMTIGSPVELNNSENSIIKDVVGSHAASNTGVRDFASRNFNMTENDMRVLEGVPMLLLVESPEDEFFE